MQAVFLESYRFTDIQGEVHSFKPDRIYVLDIINVTHCNNECFVIDFQCNGKEFYGVNSNYLILISRNIKLW
jgi:hypothetical protein